MSESTYTPALKIEHVTKSYGKTKALDDISLTIGKGEFFGFLGQNGAGKSTTIHLITGIARMQTGTIEVFGSDVVKDYRAARALVGLSPQEFNIDIFEKTSRLLNFIGGYYGLNSTQRKERTETLLQKFGLMPHKDKEFRMLSGGLKRRVLLARAMVHDPELLILDEPTAGVDVELRHELWGYLRELNAEGKTILLTSHYLDEVEMLCERIAMIREGTILKVGSKEDFIGGGKTLEEKYLEVMKQDV